MSNGDTTMRSRPTKLSQASERAIIEMGDVLIDHDCSLERVRESCGGIVSLV
jgi:hypothetical protein